jgi:membrane fusion protein, multidrug efflux system
MPLIFSGKIVKPHHQEDRRHASIEESKPAPVDRPVVPESPAKLEAKPAGRRRRWPMVLGILVAALLLFVGIPQLIHSLNTVSTDDAYVNGYVNGYVTFVAPRVSGQVARVLVDNNNRVKKGDVLVELDPKPYQVQVAIKQAAVDNAQANLVQAQANVRGLIGQARSNRFKLARAIEDVDNQVALIRARVATWEQEKATLVHAQQEFDRAERLLASKAEIDGVITRRNVNPGDNLQAGQSVMAIRSLRDIWIDPNFKETQLRNLRIGQHV